VFLLDILSHRMSVIACGWRNILNYTQNAPGRGFELAMGLRPTHRDENGMSCACTLMERGRQRSVYTLDKLRPFLSLIRNARFEPICVAPPQQVGGW